MKYTNRSGQTKHTNRGGGKHNAKTGGRNKMHEQNREGNKTHKQDGT